MNRFSTDSADAAVQVTRQGVDQSAAAAGDSARDDTPVVQAVAAAGDGDDFGLLEESIQNGGGGWGVAQQLPPFLDGAVGDEQTVPTDSSHRAAGRPRQSPSGGLHRRAVPSTLAAMPKLLDQIEADAATKLALPAGRAPHLEIARYKTFMKVESHRLQMHHRAGLGGREICRARAVMMDALLRQILAALERKVTTSQNSLPPLAIVAIGGYGRGELNPCSDIDLMFLHTGEAIARKTKHPWLALIEEGLIWDLGLKVGHSVRNLTDCELMANTDMQTKTSLIEARLVTGNQPLFALFQKLVVDKCVQGHEDEYIAARLEDQRKRRAAHGDSPTMQEPNIKNGCGGLRDFQNLLWMAFFKYRIRTLSDLEAKGLLSHADVRRLEAAYDFLLRTRTELHYITNRPVDAMTRNLQPAVGRGLGYTERSLSKRIEQFLGLFYNHTRTVYLLTRTLEERLALLPQPSRLPSLGRFLRGRLAHARRQELDGFKFLDGQIQALGPNVFREQPARLMRVFLYAQQRGLKLHPDLFFQIHDELPLVDGPFLRPDR